MSIINLTNHVPLEIEPEEWTQIASHWPGGKRFIQVLWKIANRHVIVYAEDPDEQNPQYAGIYINRSVETHDLSIPEAINKVALTMNTNRSNMHDWQMTASRCINALPPLSV